MQNESSCSTVQRFGWGATIPSSGRSPDSSFRGLLLCCCVGHITDRATTIPSNIRGCQSGTWSQRGTKVNGSHHSDNPLLRPTGIQIPTKRYATLQARAPTNIKTVQQTSLLHIESRLDRLGLLSPTHDQRSQQQSRQTAFQPVLIKTPKFLKATHRTEIKKIKISRSMVMEALRW